RHVVNSDNFNPYKNLPVKIDFDFSDWGKLMLRVECVNINKDLYYYFMNNDRLLSPGHYTYYWNGRDGNGEIYHGKFNVYFEVPQSVHIGALLIRRIPPPKISNLLCDQYRILPAYSESSTISYELDRDAKVTMVISAPNGDFATLLDEEYQVAGNQEIIWLGIDDSGHLPLTEGLYDVRITATDPNHPDLSSVNIGAISVFE
ncbi:hypothetical protein ACFL5F_07600, partial [Planctomycetota bacterium]